jgi:hypothetical protein
VKHVIETLDDIYNYEDDFFKTIDMYEHKDWCQFDYREDIDAIKHAYRELFESGKPLQDVARELLDNDKNKYVKELASFVLNTKRGIPFNRK